MSQLENFRSVLGRAETDASDNSKNGSTKSRDMEAKARGAADRKGKSVDNVPARSGGKLKRTSIGLPGELHEELKILSLWMKKEGIKDNPGLVDVVNELLRFYVEKHPSADKLLKMFYNEK